MMVAQDSWRWVGVLVAVFTATALGCKSDTDSGKISKATNSKQPAGTIKPGTIKPGTIKPGTAKPGATRPGKRLPTSPGRQLPTKPGKQLPAQDRAVHVVVGKIRLPATLALPARKAGATLPGVVLVHGSGTHDRDEKIEQAGFTFKPFAELSAALVKAGFVVLRYDKRSLVIQPQLKQLAATSRADLMKLVGTLTHDQFIDDARAALALLASQPEVDTRKTFFIGHSIAGLYAPVIARQTKVAGLVLLAPILLSFREHLVHQAEVQIGVAEKQKAAAKKAGALTPALGAAVDKQVAASKQAIAQYKKVFAMIDGGTFPKGGMFMGGTLDMFNRTVALSENLPQKFAAIAQPMLYINGKNDWICPVDAVVKHRATLEKSKTLRLVLLDDLNHFQYTSMLTFSQQMAKTVVDWLRSQ